MANFKHLPQKRKATTMSKKMNHKSFIFLLSVLTLNSCIISDCPTKEFVYENICEFEGGILVKLESFSANQKYISVIQNGIARREQVNPTLYFYIYNTFNEGDEISCKEMMYNSSSIPTLIPPLEYFP